MAGNFPAQLWGRIFFLTDKPHRMCTLIQEERNKDTVTRDFSEPSGFGRAAAALEQASAEVGQLEDDWDTLMGVETGGKAGSKRRRQPQSRARRR